MTEEGFHKFISSALYLCNELTLVGGDLKDLLAEMIDKGMR